MWNIVVLAVIAESIAGAVKTRRSSPCRPRFAYLARWSVSPHETRTQALGVGASSYQHTDGRISRVTGRSPG
jgi:hypothetical protein